MVWEKQGVVVPGPPPLEWARSHAALPVVAVAGDACRLYFSARDERGRARIAAADGRLEDDRLVVEQYRQDPALDLGELGTFDDSGVTSSCIVERDGRTYLYYSGWSLGRSVPFYFFVGLAVSDDGGATFRRVSRSPILERNEVDPFLTASPWVIVENDLWRMWYVSCTGWTLVDEKPRHHYHIRYAESDDGVRWRRTGRVCIDFRDESEYAISRPCVVRDPDRYRMWFASRGAAYALGYAESEDGLEWLRSDAETALVPLPDGWDGEMQAYPLVFDDTMGRRHMLYNGNGFGATGIGHAVHVQAER
ncbi:MAG: hypothetical protein ACXVRZ_13025 [Gaiellaceae bacterium]